MTAALTEPGRAALAEAAPKHADLIKRFLLNVLDSDQQEMLANAMDQAATHMRIHRRNEPCPECDGV